MLMVKLHTQPVERKPIAYKSCASALILLCFEDAPSLMLVSLSAAATVDSIPQFPNSPFQIKISILLYRLLNHFFWSDGH